MLHLLDDPVSDPLALYRYRDGISAVDLLDLPVTTFLTSKPITIRSGALAYEVLHILEHHRIDDLVAVDSTNRPVGIVDTQDLARFRLV